MNSILMFKKYILEQRRNVIVLLLSLSMAPFFVLLYALFFPAEEQVMDLIYIDQDNNQELVDYLQQWRHSSGAYQFKLIKAASPEEGEALVAKGAGDLFLTIPAGFDHSLSDLDQGQQPQTIPVHFKGDLTRYEYSIAAIFVYGAMEDWVRLQTGNLPPLAMLETPLGSSGDVKEFDLYIPGLLIFSLIILIFQVAMLLAREVESGTIVRYRMSPVGSASILAGCSMSVMMFGMLSFL